MQENFQQQCVSLSAILARDGVRLAGNRIIDSRFIAADAHSECLRMAGGGAQLDRNARPARPVFLAAGLRLLCLLASARPRPQLCRYAWLLLSGCPDRGQPFLTANGLRLGVTSGSSPELWNGLLSSGNVGRPGPVLASAPALYRAAALLR